LEKSGEIGMSFLGYLSRGYVQNEILLKMRNQRDIVLHVKPFCTYTTGKTFGKTVVASARYS
jgi:hypothetical protein